MIESVLTWKPGQTAPVHLRPRGHAQPAEPRCSPWSAPCRSSAARLTDDLRQLDFAAFADALRASRRDRPPDRTSSGAAGALRRAGPLRPARRHRVPVPARPVRGARRGVQAARPRGQAGPVPRSLPGDAPRHPAQGGGARSAARSSSSTTSCPDAGCRTTPRAALGPDVALGAHRATGWLDTNGLRARRAERPSCWSDALARLAVQGRARRGPRPPARLPARHRQRAASPKPPVSKVAAARSTSRRSPSSADGTVIADFFLPYELLLGLLADPVPAAAGPPARQHEHGVHQRRRVRRGDAHDRGRQRIAVGAGRRRRLRGADRHAAARRRRAHDRRARRRRHRVVAGRDRDPAAAA